MKKYYKDLLFLVLVTNFLSCQNTDFGIINMTYDDLNINAKEKLKKYDLRHYDFIDSSHYRIVITPEKLKDNSILFFNNIEMQYMDIYFKDNNVIGFKGYVNEQYEDKMLSVYKDLNQAFNKDFKQEIELQKSIEEKPREWESNELIIGMLYSELKQTKSLCILAIKKDELKNMYDQIFYSEFRNLTKYRIQNHPNLKYLEIKPSKKYKEFYEKRFKKLKEE